LGISNKGLPSDKIVRSFQYHLDIIDIKINALLWSYFLYLKFYYLQRDCGRPPVPRKDPRDKPEEEPLVSNHPYVEKVCSDGLFLKSCKGRLEWTVYLMHRLYWSIEIIDGSWLWQLSINKQAHGGSKSLWAHRLF
jgi:hypothetical protein